MSQRYSETATLPRGRALCGIGQPRNDGRDPPALDGDLIDRRIGSLTIANMDAIGLYFDFRRAPRVYIPYYDLLKIYSATKLYTQSFEAKAE
jgi:hypothetical protein